MFLTDEREPSHDDNIDEPAWSWPLNLIDGAGVEAVFSGDVHNVFYNRIGGTEFYVLPATSFVRRDFAESFRSNCRPIPNSAYDVCKSGFMVVDVYEEGHIALLVRAARDG